MQSPPKKLKMTKVPYYRRYTIMTGRDPVFINIEFASKQDYEENYTDQNSIYEPLITAAERLIKLDKTTKEGRDGIYGGRIIAADRELGERPNKVHVIVDDSGPYKNGYFVRLQKNGSFIDFQKNKKEKSKDESEESSE